MRGGTLYVCCDFVGCPGKLTWESGADWLVTSTDAELDAEAISQGWYIGKQDFCPIHNDDGEAAK